MDGIKIPPRFIQTLKDEAAKVNYSDKNRKSVERAAASFAPEKIDPSFSKRRRALSSLFHASLFTLEREGKMSLFPFR